MLAECVSYLSALAGTDFFRLTAAVALAGGACGAGAGGAGAPECADGDGSRGAAVVLKLRPRPPASWGYVLFFITYTEDQLSIDSLKFYEKKRKIF